MSSLVAFFLLTCDIAHGADVSGSSRLLPPPVAFASPRPHRAVPLAPLRSSPETNGLSPDAPSPKRKRYSLGQRKNPPLGRDQFSGAVNHVLSSLERSDPRSAGTELIISPPSDADGRAVPSDFMKHSPERLERLWDKNHFDAGRAPPPSTLPAASSPPSPVDADGALGGVLGGALGGAALYPQEISQLLQGSDCVTDPRTGWFSDDCVRRAEDRAAELAYSAADVDAYPSLDGVWDALRLEARIEASREPLLVSYMYSSILSHESLESALAFHLANKLSGTGMVATQVMSLVLEALEASPDFRRSLRLDMCAVRDRDPACTCLPDVFLYFKGFHALQTYRVANHLWYNGRKILAHYLQSRSSQAFQIDIHPGADLGSGLMLDHGTGIIVGETAVIGDSCSILHHVTLGGSGRASSDRHPKVGRGVLIGAGASLLGNIQIGDGCQIGAGSLVIQDLPKRSVAVGVPAKIIGTLVDDKDAAVEMDQVHLDLADGEVLPYQGDGI